MCCCGVWPSLTCNCNGTLIHHTIPISTTVFTNEQGRLYLLTILGLSPDQSMLENEYQSIQSVYSLCLFIKKLKSVREQDMKKECVVEIVSGWQELLEKIVDYSQQTTPASTLKQQLANLSNATSNIVSQLVSKLTDIDHSLRTDQLMHEYNRITYENCTLSNACLQRWLGRKSNNPNSWQLEEVFFKSSPPNRYLPKYERITMHLIDKHSNERRATSNNSNFVFLPSLSKLLQTETHVANQTTGVKTIVDNMICTTWECLLRDGYYVDERRKELLGLELRKFYESGLMAGRDGSMPLLL